VTLSETGPDEIAADRIDEFVETIMGPPLPDRFLAIAPNIPAYSRDD